MVAVLLFTVGLKFDLHLEQVMLTTVGYFFAIALAMTPLQEPSA